jgi:hypothetical protein
MTDLRDLPLQLHFAVLRGEMTLEEANNELHTPSPDEVERTLDGKPPKDLRTFTVLPCKPPPQAKVERLALEMVNGLAKQVGQLEKRLAELEVRTGELEQIVIDLADRLIAKRAA